MRFSGVAAIAVSSLLATAGLARADVLFYQGFETNTSGWIAESGGDANGAIARTASGGGSLGLTAATGSYYGEVHNGTNAYQPGYGTGGFSFLNGDGTTPTPYPGSSFSQSISVYINTTTPAAPVAGVPAFWIDMSPSLIAPDGVGCDPAACSDEHNFQLSYTGSAVTVGVDGGPSVLTINSSGWYTFETTYQKGPTSSSLVENNLDIFDSTGTLLSSTPALGNSDGSTLESSNLAGPGYIWLPVWQDGFSNDLLGIDNVRADADVPEPSALGIFIAALLCTGWLGLRSRRGA